MAMMNTRRGIVTAAALFVAVAAWPAAAQTRLEREQNRRDLERQIENIRQDIRDLTQKSTDADKQSEDDRKSYESVNKEAKEAAAKLAAAKGAATEARAAETAAIAGLRRKADAEPRAIQLDEGLKNAQEAYSGAAEKVTTPLAETEPYKRAAAQVAQAKAEFETLKTNGAMAAELAAAAQKIIDQDAALSKIREDALAVDPAARSAKRDLVDATKAVAEQNRKQEEAVKNDPIRVAARQRVDDTAKDLAAATDANAAAQKKLNAAKGAYATSFTAAAKVKTQLKQARDLLGIVERQLRSY
jgi:chromosome segregation ATPase